MDPFTLFALAQGAVAAVKKGCDLYKEIKGVAGNVKEIIQDLDKQFHTKYEGKKPPPEAVKQLNEEKKRIKDLGEKNPDDIYLQLGEQLGAYYENYAKCRAIFDAEEKHSQELYSGDVSVGKRALQRVLMRKKLERMSVELREIMTYQTPPELGALYTEVSEMMHVIGLEQEKAIAAQMAREAKAAAIKRRRMERWKTEAMWGVGLLFVLIVTGMAMVWIIQDRIKKYPHLGTEWIPKTEEQRKRDAEPKIYTGR